MAGLNSECRNTAGPKRIRLTFQIRYSCPGTRLLHAVQSLPGADGASVSACGITTLLALARSRPSLVRLRINSRSNSARPPRTVSVKQPCGVVVSAQVSRSDRKPAPLITPAKSGSIVSWLGVNPEGTSAPLPAFVCHEQVVSWRRRAGRQPAAVHWLACRLSEASSSRPPGEVGGAPRRGSLSGRP